MYNAEKSEGKIKINQTLNKQMKTKVRRNTGPARRENLLWSKAKILAALRGNSTKTLAITNVIITVSAFAG